MNMFSKDTEVTRKPMGRNRSSLDMKGKVIFDNGKTTVLVRWENGVEEVVMRGALTEVVKK